MSLMRLAYASEATFEAKPVEKGVEPHVARILMTSRKNNAKDQLVGGLYYGNDRFFQYLEGEEDAVRRTYDRILKDDRHRNIVTVHDSGQLEDGSSFFVMEFIKGTPLSKLKEEEIFDCDVRHPGCGHLTARTFCAQGTDFPRRFTLHAFFLRWVLTVS